MPTGQASYIVIILNQVQTDGTGVPWIRQEFSRKCVADLIAIIFIFIWLNGLRAQSVLPFKFLRGIACTYAVLLGRKISHSASFFVCRLYRIFGMLVLRGL